MQICTWGATIDKQGNKWLPIQDSDILLKSDKDGKIHYVGQLSPNEESFPAKHILKVYEYNNKIFLFSRIAYGIWTVDMDTLKIERVFIKEEDSMIADVVMVGSKAWIIPISYDNPLIMFSCDNFSAEIVSWGEKPFEGNSAFMRAIVSDGIIYTATRKKGNVYLCGIDTVKKDVSFVHLNVVMINGIVPDNDKMWMFCLNSDKKTVLKLYNIQSKEFVNEIFLQNIAQIEDTGKMHYFRMHLQNYKIYFLPSDNEDIYVYDIKAGIGFKLQYPMDLTRNMNYRDELIFVETQVYDNKIYIFPFGFKEIINIDMVNGNITIEKVDIDNKEMRKIMRISSERASTLTEGVPFNLEDFISL